MSVLDGDFNNGRQSLNVIMDKKNKKPWTVKIREKEFPGICRLFMLIQGRRVPMKEHLHRHKAAG